MRGISGVYRFRRMRTGLFGKDPHQYNVQQLGTLKRFLSVLILHVFHKFILHENMYGTDHRHSWVISVI